VIVAAATRSTWELPTIAAAAAAGVLVGGALVDRGLRQLQEAGSTGTSWAGRMTGAAGGVVGVLAARHTGSWWPLPALLVWGYTLAAAATCDAATQRIPTPLVRRGGLAVTGLILVAAAGAGHWRWIAQSATGAAVAGLMLAACWRFAGAGFGDVRLAALGGLGLANPTQLGVDLAVGAFVLIIATQVGVTLARGGNSHNMIPFGPAIATALALAAIA